MWIIYGRSHDYDSVGPLCPATCPSCEAACWLQLVQVSGYFSLFFIRVWRYEQYWTVACSRCGAHKPIQTVSDRERARDLWRLAQAWAADEIPEADYRRALGRLKTWELWPNARSARIAWR
jgi:hypothetical protein